MDSWLTDIMNQFGYWGVAFLITLENVFPPIPSEVILTFGGFMTKSTELTITGVVIAATIGSVLGALILYYIGRMLDVERLERMVDRWGYILRLTKDDVHKANDWFKKIGPWAVFLCRFIPLIRSLISVPAGMSKMNIWSFTALTIIGTLIWNIVLVNLGAALGLNWEKIVAVMDTYSNITYAVIALVFVAGCIYFVKSRKNNQQND